MPKHDCAAGAARNRSEAPHGHLRANRLYCWTVTVIQHRCSPAEHPLARKGALSAILRPHQVATLALWPYRLGPPLPARSAPEVGPRQPNRSSRGARDRGAAVQHASTRCQSISRRAGSSTVTLRAAAPCHRPPRRASRRQTCTNASCACWRARSTPATSRRRTRTPLSRARTPRGGRPRRRAA